ncbi:hypothetical protein IMZ48_05725 [Candidatus Bathyarchaeota archaeon]|nr:hypothetical protein [Candidatus Bathyarchaeota archaeon]
MAALPPESPHRPTPRHVSPRLQHPTLPPSNTDNNSYGTFDHLLLLHARLSEFASDDLPRKRKANKIPAPPGSSPPMFPGMFPTPGKVSAPTGFSQPRDHPSPQSDSADDTDLEQATRAALSSWEAIHAAFNALRSRLGPEFSPLSDEYTDRRETPFGAAVQYRTFSAAGIWMNFHMGMICLHRAHPSMPPTAMMAAGRAAGETAPFAKEIGRIAAGLSDEDVSNRSEITTLVGAAFIESCFPLFVAGIQVRFPPFPFVPLASPTTRLTSPFHCQVSSRTQQLTSHQYQDSAQRHWLVRRLRDISRLTGWASARQIAEGCESSWVRAAHMGRGPVYVRSADQPAAPPVVSRQSRRIDRKLREMAMDEEGAIVLAKADRAHLALGLLGVEGDLDRLRLEDDG